MSDTNCRQDTTRQLSDTNCRQDTARQLSDTNCRQDTTRQLSDTNCRQHTHRGSPLTNATPSQVSPQVPRCPASECPTFQLHLSCMTCRGTAATHTHNGLVLERPEPRCTSMSAALDVGHARLDTFLRCYQGCLPSCSLRSTFHFRRQLSGTGRNGGQETNNRTRILRSFIIVAKRQPCSTRRQCDN